jgi:hypothetical protein
MRDIGLNFNSKMVIGYGGMITKLLLGNNDYCILLENIPLDAKREEMVEWLEEYAEIFYFEFKEVQAKRFSLNNGNVNNKFLQKSKSAILKLKN